MTAVGRGIRNAFRSAVQTISVVVILGLTIGLSFVMLIACHSVSDKIATTLSSIGNTVTIGVPGNSVGGQLGQNLTTTELVPIARPRGTAAGTAARRAHEGADRRGAASATARADGRHHSDRAARAGCHTTESDRIRQQLP